MAEIYATIHRMNVPGWFFAFSNRPGSRHCNSKLSN